MRSGNAPKGSEIDSRDRVLILESRKKRISFLAKYQKSILRFIARVKLASQSDNCLRFHASVVSFSPPQWFLQRATTCSPKLDENRKVYRSFGKIHPRRGKAWFTFPSEKNGGKKWCARKRWRWWQRHVARERRNDNAAAQWSPGRGKLSRTFHVSTDRDSKNRSSQPVIFDVIKKRIYGDSITGLSCFRVAVH